MISRVRCQNCGGNPYVFCDYSEDEPNVGTKLTLHCIWCGRELDENGNVIVSRSAPSLANVPGRALNTVVRLIKGK